MRTKLGILAAASKHDGSIWAFALGYFVCYAPYSALTKATSQGMIPGMARGLSGFELLPITTMASLAGMMLFLTVMDLWKYAGSRVLFGLRVPVPGRWTLLSGLCTAAIIATTTLAYTFSGVSIVFMMLLMRGGVLVIAPLVDAVSRREVRWFSWVALALSIGALLTTTAGTTSYAVTLIAVLDVAIYLLAYFIRLQFMSRLAKSNDRRQSLRYFVEEQMVATPAIVAALGLIALYGGARGGQTALEIRSGFIDFWRSGAVLAGIAVGLLSQGTGVFGGLILLDRRENTFCIPVNRASSVLAGVVATLGMALVFGTPGVPTAELVGVTLVVAAIVVLALPSFLGRSKQVTPGPAAP
jgi:hypothetical protein